MNRDDLTTALADKRPRRTKRDATEYLTDLIDILVREVAAGHTVTITGLGTFEPARREPRTGRNPHTGDPIPIPATVTPKFRPASAFKKYVSHPELLPHRSVGQRAPARGVSVPA